MKKPYNLFLVFNLLNDQKDYARAMDLITNVTNSSSKKMTIAQEDDFITNKVFRVITIPTASKDFFLDSIQGIEPIFEHKEEHKKKIRDLSAFRSKIREYNLYYYFRIHDNEYTDIVNIHYFLLLLQESNLNKDNTVVLFPNQNNPDYYRYSHYLQLMPAKYQLFYGKKDGNISKMDEKSASQTTFYPLLLVDSILYEKLTRSYQIIYDESIFNEEGSLRDRFLRLKFKPEPEGDMKLLFSLGNAHISNFSKGKVRKAEKEARVLSEFCDCLSETGGVTVLEYAIFSILAGSLTEIQAETGTWISIKECVEKAKFLSAGIMQIVENSIHYSQYGKGLLSLRIHKDGRYIDQQFGEYGATEQQEILHIMISDANLKETIIDNFTSDKRKASNKLIEVKDKLSLSDFFGEYDQGEAKEEWLEARKENPLRSLGLLRFSNTVRFLAAALKVRSCVDYVNKQDRLYFYNVTGRTLDFPKREKEEPFIPGTQFSLAIRLSEKQRVTKQKKDLSLIPLFADRYESYAKFLEYTAEDVDSVVLDYQEIKKGQCEDMPSMSQEKKDLLSDRWRIEFNNKISLDKQIKAIDLGKVIWGSQMIEPFCKGFLMSNLVTKGERCIITFFNTPTALINCFGETLAANPYIVGGTEIQVFFFCADKPEGAAPLPLVGRTVYEILNNLSHYEFISYEAPKFAELKNNKRIKREKTKKKDEITELAPIDVLLKYKGETVFERGMKRLSSNLLVDNQKKGYKVSPTHMRLGNKVHIDDFYEMSIFFQAQNAAKRTAYLFLQQIREELNRKTGNLLFYGYASYSRAILTAMAEITKRYFEEKRINRAVDFAIYQNDLVLESTSSNVQMYFSRVNRDEEKGKQIIEKNTKVIQIVPISSSLTTFNKMWVELCNQTKQGEGVELAYNLTALWVRDKIKEDQVDITCSKYEDCEKCSRYHNCKKCTPSDLEKQYWSKANVKNKIITTEPALLNVHPRYLIYQESVWRDPLDCKKCFPDEVILELPLVETDPTSTIPTQQLYLKPASDANVEPDKNDERIARLKEYVYYGHLERASNHFQYYINTQGYFQQEKEKVAEWLEGLYKSDCNVISSTINVLVSPQQPSNVELNQYVNNYYFNGNAISIVINAEKEFRSNVKAEYKDILSYLKEAEKNGIPICYTYVDTMMTTGSTFFRIASLLNSIVPDENKNHTDSIKFDKIFLLVNRFSEDSKKVFLKNIKHFYQYVTLHISSMRTYGDSCIGCKLEKTADKFYKHAATRGVSSYWEIKKYWYSPIRFDKWGEAVDVTIHDTLVDQNRRQYAKKRADQQKSKGFLRMVCSHRASFYLNRARGREKTDYFQEIRSFFEEIINTVKKSYDVTSQNVSVIFYEMGDKKNPVITAQWDSGTELGVIEENLLYVCFKILVRPFFSFDYKVRSIMLDILVILSEYLLDTDNDTDIFIKTVTAIIEDSVRKEEYCEKKYLLENGNLNWIIIGLARELESIFGAKGDAGKNKCFFLQRYLLKGLADLHSQYLLRKKTIKKINHFLEKLATSENKGTQVKNFYQHYLRSVLRITSSNTDETKTLWLEHLLLTGEEYKKEQIQQIDNWNIADYFEIEDDTVKEAFEHFWSILFVENNRLIYEGMHELIKGKTQIKECIQSNKIDKAKKLIEKKLNEYHLKNFKKMLFLDRGLYNTEDEKIPDTIIRDIIASLKLMVLLDESGDSSENGVSDNDRVVSRYKRLRTILIEIVKNTFQCMDENNIEDVAIMVENSLDLNVQSKEKYFTAIVYKNNEYKKAEKILNSKRKLLDEDSFFIGEGYIIIKLDNNFDNIKNTMNINPLLRVPPIQKIQASYLYLPCDPKKKTEQLLLIRKILMYRNKLIEWLERDFNNNAISELTMISQMAELLARDKVGDHKSRPDIESVRRLLQNLSDIDLETLQKYIEKFAKFESDKYIKENRVNKKLLEEIREEKKQYIESLLFKVIWMLQKNYVNSQIARLFRSAVQCNQYKINNNADIENEINQDQPPLYFKEGEEEHPNDAALENLGDSIGEKTLMQTTRRNYFRIILHAVTFYFQKNDSKQYEMISGKTEQEKLDNLVEAFKQFDCISCNGKYYRTEYIIGVLLDCIYSAILHSFDWDEKLGDQTSNTSDTCEQYHFLRNQNADEKCKIWVCREKGNKLLDYLVIRNITYIPLRSVWQEMKEKLDSTHFGDMRGGLSKDAITWYIKHIWDELPEDYPEPIMTYERGCMGEKDQEIYFTTKLPILER